MRKGGIVILLVITGIYILFVWLFSNKIVEKNLERIGEKIVGARVDFRKVHISPFKLFIRWEGLEVADPDNTWRNIIETKECSFELRPDALLKKRFIIERFYLSGLEFNTARSTDGALKKKPKKVSSKKRKDDNKEKEKESKVEVYLKKEKKAIPIFNPKRYLVAFDYKSLIKDFKPQTPEKIKEKKIEYEKELKTLNSKLIDYGDRVENYVKKVDILSKEISKNTNNPAVLKARLIKIKNIINELEKLKKEGRMLSDEINMVYRSAKSDIGRIDEWINEDYSRIKEKLKLPDINSKDIAIMLFGKKVVETTDRFVMIVKKVRKVLQKARDVIPKKNIPDRRKGIDVVFVKEKDLPALWIKEIFVGGKTKKGIRIKGMVNDVSSNQRLTGKITTLYIEGEGLKNEKMYIKGSFDYLGNKPIENLDISFFSIPLENSVILNDKSFRLAFLGGYGYIASNFRFSKNSLKSEITFTGKKLIFKAGAPETDKTVNEVIADVFSKINNINLHAKMDIGDKNSSLVISSNIGDLFMNSLKDVYSEKIKDMDNKIKKYMAEKKAEYKSEYLKYIDDGKSKLEDKVNGYMNLIKEKKGELLKQKVGIENRLIQLKKELQQEVEKKKKEAESKVKEEKKKLEGEIKKKVKSIF